MLAQTNIAATRVCAQCLSSGVVSSHASNRAVLSEDELRAWRGLLRAHVYLLREFEKDLQRSHRLSVRSHDVLLHLALAPQHRLRMTVLAKAVFFSPSGLTRLIDQLEGEGLVLRERREDDTRSYDAVLSAQGLTRLTAAHEDHLRLVRELFIDHLTEAQIAQLIAIWNAVDPRFTAGSSDPVVAGSSDPDDAELAPKR
jgi:DNA-binding MarR family transcriptional regulator